MVVVAAAGSTHGGQAARGRAGAGGLLTSAHHTDEDGRPDRPQKPPGMGRDVRPRRRQCIKITDIFVGDIRGQDEVVDRCTASTRQRCKAATR